SAASPPPLEMRRMDRRPPARSAKRIVSPTHDALAPAAAMLQMGSGLAPPVTRVFHSLPRALKPSHLPSDDQNGDAAPSEPSTGWTSVNRKSRTYSEVVPAREATKATVRPSG